MSKTEDRSLFWKLSFVGLLFFLVLGFLVVGGLVGALFGGVSTKVSRPMVPSVLVMDLEGMIADATEFTKMFRKHIKNVNVRAFILRINSPGGLVGPSQEIYSELKRAHEETEKPVIAVLESVAASGAYYVASGASHIVAGAGTLMGSIGVIMMMANLEGLYDWAKIRRFSIKTGRFKDTGADYRPMQPEEVDYLQDLLVENLGQFKQHIREGRGDRLRDRTLEEYADGRVFTGARGVQLGFADRVGYFSDAEALAQELTGADEPLKVFEPKKKEAFWVQVLSEMQKVTASPLDETIKSWRSLLGQPLYLMPHTVFP